MTSTGMQSLQNCERVRRFVAAEDEGIQHATGDGDIREMRKMIAQAIKDTPECRRALEGKHIQE
jgi:hypothetical protein